MRLLSRINVPHFESHGTVDEMHVTDGEGLFEPYEYLLHVVQTEMSDGEGHGRNIPVSGVAFQCVQYLARFVGPSGSCQQIDGQRHGLRVSVRQSQSVREHLQRFVGSAHLFARLTKLPMADPEIWFNTYASRAWVAATSVRPAE